jgi:adenylylsulfate kinase
MSRRAPLTQGATVWLTGLPSSGKTTLAQALASRLTREGNRVEVLDGDEIRTFLSAGLGFTREDRDTNVQRIGLVAEVLARNGILVLVPVIAPYEDSREAVRKRHESPPRSWSARSATSWACTHRPAPGGCPG